MASSSGDPKEDTLLCEKSVKDVHQDTRRKKKKKRYQKTNGASDTLESLTLTYPITDFNYFLKI